MQSKSFFIAFVLAAIVVVPTGVFAKNERARCPPGLAKKNPPCVPPGLAGRGISVGDTLLEGDYIIVRNPSRYRLPRLGRGESYYRIGDSFVRVDRETRKVLELIEALGAVLN